MARINQNRYPEPMPSEVRPTPNPNTLPPASPRWAISVFNPAIRIAWLVIVVITVLSEVVPIPLLPRAPFYAYCAGKAVLFSAVGYLTPLTFWRFNALNRGIIFAAASAALVEGLQGAILHGHSFHWYELVGKLILILIGFALALDARYDRRISIGPLKIALSDEHMAA